MRVQVLPAPQNKKKEVIIRKEKKSHLAIIDMFGITRSQTLLINTPVV
ncbi:MAG: hypothetical protein ACFFAT_14100 [Promethearchaeota archaeon]